MVVSEYDAIITNFEGSDFTAYYKKGINLKLSDGMTVINIYKPGALKKINMKNKIINIIKMQ